MNYEKREHLEQNEFHFEADNQRSTTGFKSSQYLIGCGVILD
jgi:hypothetical protein